MKYTRSHTGNKTMAILCTYVPTTGYKINAFISQQPHIPTALVMLLETNTSWTYMYVQPCPHAHTHTHTT